MAKETDFFVRIKNPKQTRRLILENTRDVLKVLQSYEDFKKTREKRSHLINAFKVQMSGLRYLVLELKKMLPKATVKEIKRPSLEPEKPATEIRKLEQELAEIEAKLGELS